MTALLGKAGKKLFEKHLQQYEPADPLYEQYTDKRGKQRRRKRELPPGLSKRDMKILRSVNRRAHYLDKGFSICGLRFGWTFLIGIIPGLGDAVDATLNYTLVVRKARQAEIPSWLLRQMLLNNAISAAAGFVPIVGDVVLAAWKANSRNAVLLSEFLRIRGEEYLKLTAEGKDAKAASAETAKTATEKEKETEVVKGVTKADAEQVKPGAGKEKGEVVPVETVDAWAVVDTPAATEKDAAAPAQTRSRQKSFSAFFSSGSRKKAPAAGEKGRFVEDVGSNLNKSQAKVPTTATT